MIPIQLHIMDLIGDRLFNISLLNGYHFDVEKIKRERISNFTGKELPIIFYWSENDSRVEGKTANELRRIPIYVAAFFKTRDDILVNQAIEFGADIYTAIHRNPISPNYIDPIERDLGTEIVDSLFVNEIAPIIGAGETPYAGVMVDISVNYSIKHGSMIIGAC